MESHVFFARVNFFEFGTWGFRSGAIEIKFGVLSASEIAKHARRIERKRDSRAARAVCAA